MAEYWWESRQKRAALAGRPGVTVVEEQSDGGGFRYADREILMTDAAVAALGTDADPEYTDLVDDENPQPALAQLHLRLFRYEGGEALPAKVASLRDQARTADPGGDCDVALHYVLAGEGTSIPRGGPAHPPQPTVAAPALSWGSGSPVVAVVDTGLDPNSTTGLSGGVVVGPGQLDHDLLVAPMPPGRETEDLGAEAGHGTFITWLVERMVGQDVRVASLKALDADGFGTEASVVEALRRLREDFPRDHDYPAGRTVGVVNLSLGGYTDDTDHVPPIDTDTMPLALGRELQHWHREFPDTIFVAAAGNDGNSTRPFWPAAAAATNSHIVAVGSLDSDLTASDFSNSGSWVSACTIGRDIVGDYPHGRYPLSDTAFEMFDGGAMWSGTSFAAPIVAAQIARIAIDAGLDPIDAWEKLRDTARAAGAELPGLGVVWDPRGSGPGGDPQSF